MNTTFEPQVLRTTAGDFTLQEYRLRLGGREWAIAHTGAMLTHGDEQFFFKELRDRLPYGVALWPSSIALAHEVASRGEQMRGARVLELGAGTGLPGIVAASLGARVVQTDAQELAMSICRRNGERNGVGAIEHRLADWTVWDDADAYDYILGSDVLYGEGLHGALRGIFEGNLAPGGRVLLSDPFRAPGLKLLGALEEDGWKIALSKWNVGEDESPRPIGIYELTPPAVT